MAFISGYKEIYKCKFCLEEIETDFLTNKFHHNSNGLIWVNDYPLPCKYNGKSVQKKYIIKISQPIIEMFGLNTY